VTDLAYLRSPRWLAGIALAVGAIVVFVGMGSWQLSRLSERRDLNAVLLERTAAVPVDLERLVIETGEDIDQMVWRRVVVAGSYVGGEEILLEGRSHKPSAGSNVLTPLRWDRERAVIVNRGWIPISTELRTVVTAARDVVVTGVLRRSEGAGLLGGGETGTADRLGSIDLERINAQTVDDLFPLYIQLQTQRPAQVVPEAVPIPDLGDGPHLSYAIQWFVFALVVAFGFPVLVWRTARPATRSSTTGIPSMPSSEPSALRDQQRM